MNDKSIKDATRKERRARKTARYSSQYRSYREAELFRLDARARLKETKA